MSQELKKELLSWVKLIVLAVLIATGIYFYGFNLMTVQGKSMQPTLQNGDKMFVNRAVYLLSEPNLSDVVILKEPAFSSWSDPFLVKRVVAIAGDTVEIRGGILYRNGKQVSEPYTDVGVEDGDYGPDTILKGNVFVMGDNRHLGSSKDSRYFGQVPLQYIVGRAEWIVWPFAQAEVLE
jgi:signal peptidase I